VLTELAHIHREVGFHDVSAIGFALTPLRSTEDRGRLLRRPAHWNIKTADLQTLQGKLGRLTACRKPLDRLGCEKRQTYEPADVLLADSVALGDLDHRSATDEILEPGVCSRHRSEQRLIGFARRSRRAVDYESKLNLCVANY
jgi:hypothetical protein